MRCSKDKHAYAVTLDDLAKKWRRFAELEKRITAKLTEGDPHASINDETGGN